MKLVTAGAIAGIELPDTALVREATEYIRDTEDDLLFHHSRRVFYFGALQGRRRGLQPDLELLYVATMFHDIGLTERYRTTSQLRFEVDGTDVLGIGRGDLAEEELNAVTAAHPRPDFKNRILRAFAEGVRQRPASTFGTVNADVLAHFDDSFVREDFVEVIRSNDWPE
ncbi:HD domain-containing protein [Mycolicibacterium farcinogenes]|nr:HD domain-containing protein [Mycolicibacterium farcinogenes]